MRKQPSYSLPSPIIMRTALPAALLLSLSLLSPLAHAASKTWTINLKDADINALVTEVSMITGRSFVLDPRVKGTVTVITSKPLSADAIYDMLQSVLSVNGFLAVPAGDIVKIVPDANAKTSTRVDGSNKNNSEELVTRVIPLGNVSAIELVPILRPLVPQYGHMAAVPSSNTLIVTDHARNINALMDIINRLDDQQGDQLEVIQLQHVAVADLLQMLDNLTPSATAPGQGKDKTFGRARLIADDKSNRLIVKGDADSREQLRQMINQLDQPSQKIAGVAVIRLHHATAKQMAELLRGMGSGDSPAATSSTSTASSSTTAGNASASATLRGFSVQADESMNALVVRASPSQLAEVRQVVAQLDVRRTQVLIQAAIVEVTGDVGQKLGVQWLAGDPNHVGGAISFDTAGISVGSVLAAIGADKPELLSLGNGATIGGGKLDANGKLKYGVLLQALGTSSNANLLSTPSVMTLDNQEAKIVVGQNVPFITGSSTSAGTSTSNPFQTIQREDVGLTLKVVPHISDDGVVRLEVEQVVSAVVPAADGIKSADIITSKREIKTTILADDGETIVLGGLMQDDTVRTQSRVPLLGDIPLLGRLFRADSKGHTKRNLLVFLQPSILRDKRGAGAVTNSAWSRLRSLEARFGQSGRLSLREDTPLPARIDALYHNTTETPAGSSGSTEATDVQPRPTNP